MNLTMMQTRPGREADHSPPSSAEVKKAWSYTSTPPMNEYEFVWIDVMSYSLYGSETWVRRRWEEKKDVDKV
jgi:hypothetical protein